MTRKVHEEHGPRQPHTDDSMGFGTLADKDPTQPPNRLKKSFAGGRDQFVPQALGHDLEKTMGKGLEKGEKQDKENQANVQIIEHSIRLRIITRLLLPLSICLCACLTILYFTITWYLSSLKLSRCVHCCVRSGLLVSLRSKPGAPPFNQKAGPCSCKVEHHAAVAVWPLQLTDCPQLVLL